MQPKVSVVMPMLNSAEYLRECLDSAVNQTLKNIEIICVDAGSTDGTLDILQEYAAKDSRISIIHSDMKSYGRQMNLGLQAAKGEYLAILESDDYIKLDMYETLTEIADANELEAIRADYSIFLGEKDNRTFLYQNVTNDKGKYGKVVTPSNNVEYYKDPCAPWSGIYSIDFLRKYNISLNESLGASYQDNGFWFSVFSQVTRMMFYNKSFYMYRRDNPNASVMSKGKVYCLCGEYDFIRNMIRKEESFESKYAPLVSFLRYKNYIWNLNRISSEYKLEFLVRFANDFKKIKESFELKEEFFDSNDWKKLNEIMQDPVAHYYRNYDSVSKENSIVVKELNDELMNIKNSCSYKIGRFITFIPRKINGLIRCYKEHGLSYTINRIKFHIGLRTY